MTLLGSTGMARDRRLEPGVHADPALLGALVNWQAAAVLQDEVDPITTELVRLRCATHHDCHT